jgi:CheY-like chemotaxis protein
MAAKDLERFSILVVDDEEEICELVCENLERNGFKNVFTAGNGLEALEVLKQCCIDLVLSDLLMPNMNGMELYGEIQRLEKPPKFVLITGSDLEDVSPKPTDGVDLIQKPFSFDDLSKKVSGYCQQLSAETR